MVVKLYRSAWAVPTHGVIAKLLVWVKTDRWQASVHTRVSEAISNTLLYLRPGEKVVLGRGRSG